MSDFEEKATVTKSSMESGGESISSFQGRSVFVVETVAAGVSVQAAFLTEDQKVILVPAVFPDLVYALSQVDELRNVVIQHFSRAAQVGAQVMAANAAMNINQVDKSSVLADEPVN